MRLAIASDHAGFKLKESLVSHLKSQNIEVVDFGASSEDAVDYPEYAKKVAEGVSRKECTFGVLVCGSGIGMCMAANRFKGVRAAVVNDEFDAEMSKKHNNANIICFGARKIDEAKAKVLLSIWLNATFEGGRHQRRVDKIEI